MASVTVSPNSPDPFSKMQAHILAIAVDDGSMERFSSEVHDLFEQNLDHDALLGMSKSLRAEMRQHLIASPQCMLPSFNYDLPTGEEHGTYLALEVGGSNLRMAMVELRGRRQGTQAIRLRRTMSSPIDTTVRQLQNYAFFDWMATNIRQLLLMEGENADVDAKSPPLRMGVAWSFPIESVQLRLPNPSPI